MSSIKIAGLSLTSPTSIRSLWVLRTLGVAFGGCALNRRLPLWINAKSSPSTSAICVALYVCKASAFSFFLIFDADERRAKYRLAPPASGETITASRQFGILSLMYLTISGSQYRLSTGMSK